MKRKKKINPNDFIMDFIIYNIMIFMVIVTICPIWHVVVASFSTASEIAMADGLMFWPKRLYLEAYKLAFENRDIMIGLKNSLLILAGSLPLNITFTAMCAYFWSCTGMMFKKPIIMYMMVTMYFSGGMIPAFLNIRDLGLYNTLWSLIIPGAISLSNCIICRTAMEAIPDSLKESAYLDGANDFQIIFKVILPLIKATLAVLILYYGVGHWNSWFHASIYIKEDYKLPVQNIMRYFLVSTQEMERMGIDTQSEYAETIKYAAIVITSVPVMCVYPFLQKHFTKGALMGAVKG